MKPIKIYTMIILMMLIILSSCATIKKSQHRKPLNERADYNPKPNVLERLKPFSSRI